MPRLIWSAYHIAYHLDDAEVVVSRSAEFLGEADEKPSRPADVAEPIGVFILHDFANELRAALAELIECLVDVVHGEHDAEIAECVHWRIAVIRDGRRREEAGKLEAAVAVRGAHHGNLNALIAEASHASSPFPFDRGPPFELEAELAKEINHLSEIFDDYTYIIHPFERHESDTPNLQGF